MTLSDGLQTTKQLAKTDKPSYENDKRIPNR